MNRLTTSMLILATFAAPSAFAHTELASTTPADRATLATAPENVELEFSEPLRLTALTIQKEGASKRSLGPLPAATAKSFTVALPGLEDGHYVVAWRALAEDAHVMTGEFMFAIGATAGPDAHDHAAAHDAATTHDAATHDQAAQGDHGGAH